MTPKQIALMKHRKMQLAMEPLLGDDRFTTFLDAVKELKEEAIGRSIMHDSVRSDRATLAAMGEIRAYVDILNIAEDYRLQIESEQDRAIEEAERLTVAQ
jgi:hypothetical protein